MPSEPGPMPSRLRLKGTLAVSLKEFKREDPTVILEKQPHLCYLQSLPPGDLKAITTEYLNSLTTEQYLSDISTREPRRAVQDSPILSLSDELLLMVIAYLSPEDSTRIGNACHRLYEIHWHVHVVVPLSCEDFCDKMLLFGSLGNTLATRMAEWLGVYDVKMPLLERYRISQEDVERGALLDKRMLKEKIPGKMSFMDRIFEGPMKSYTFNYVNYEGRTRCIKFYHRPIYEMWCSYNGLLGR